ncbi:hypothetical protein VNO80_28874 [Phaseolus coccineus]|uniref:Uncharacterized protein n=1 Tax=Phaseolus coccineus TaxID=3886 RepID=A0AAN9LB67_PHACN
MKRCHIKVTFILQFARLATRISNGPRKPTQTFTAAVLVPNYHYMTPRGDSSISKNPRNHTATYTHRTLWLWQRDSSPFFASICERGFLAPSLMQFR